LLKVSMERPLERLSQAYTRHLQGADVTAVTQAEFFWPLRIRFACSACPSPRIASKTAAFLQAVTVSAPSLPRIPRKGDSPQTQRPAREAGRDVGTKAGNLNVWQR
jgi:hypothetical protein